MVASVFIINIQSQLQPDTGEETTALLRVLIYKIDNTSFGTDTPTLPQWTGPPHSIVQVQALLYASLASSFLSAFLAMLGKQWLNQYASTDMRGTAIERSQNRQRKLDGIIAWYFNYVMELLPLIMQAALLLLGCALSRYLWGVNITVASVVIGITSFGIFLYLFIITAGTISGSCPYQTPGSHALHYLWPQAKKILHSTTLSVASALGDGFRGSETRKVIRKNVSYHEPWQYRREIVPFFRDMIFELPRALAIDVYHLGKVMTWSLHTFAVGAYHLSSTTAISLVSYLHGSPSTLERGVDWQLAVLDLRCISWMLQTSLDKTVHLATLKHLAAMTELVDFDPTLAKDCFNAFIGCINVYNYYQVVVTQGLEELAAVSALCLFSTISHLLVMDPTSSILEEVHQCYLKVFPDGGDFRGHQFYHTMNAVQCLYIQSDPHWDFRWNDYKSSTHEHIMVAHNFVKIAQFKYKETQRKIPCFVLQFALHSLSLDPPPSTSVIANCLLIIAIDLGCDVSDLVFNNK